MPPAIKQRCFIVGCPRSGTTLVQAILASHPDVFSFPETHFFRKIRGRFGRRGPSWLASPRAASRQLRRLAVELGVKPYPRVPYYLRISARAYERAFVQLIDRACVRAGKSVWVEKSPTHLHYIDEILRIIPTARFVHVLRHGRAVVSSFYGLCKTSPDWVRQVLPGDPIDNLRHDEKDHRVLDAIVDRWNADLRITASWSRDPAHYVVVLEDLLSDPEAEIHSLCSFLGLRYTDEMLDQRRAAATVIGRMIKYPHMRGPLAPLGRHSCHQGPDGVSLSSEKLGRVDARLAFGGVPYVGAGSPGEGDE